MPPTAGNNDRQGSNNPPDEPTFQVKIPKDMPPVFMAAGGDDNVSAAYPEIYRELKDAGASVELHIYAGVGHGFGLQPTSPLSVSGWPDRLWEWLFDRGLLTKK